jgi:hypothetical protein
MRCCLQSRLQQEQERCLHYLEPSSRRPLLQAVEQQLLAAHTPQILAKVRPAAGSVSGVSSSSSSSSFRVQLCVEQLAWTASNLMQSLQLQLP